MRVAVTCLQLIRDLPQYVGVFEEAGLEPLVPAIAGQHLAGEALISALRDCVGVIAGDDRFTADVFEACPGLRAISKWGVGVDGIDVRAAAAHGVAMSNTPGMFDDEVADVSMAYVTMLARRLHQVDRGVRAGGWPKPPGKSLRGASLGIVGLGGIGRALASRAMAAGMDVLGHDPSEAASTAAGRLGVRHVQFEALLADSDFISINCPLNASTHNLFDDNAFERMRSGSFLINTGRGPVVSTKSLVRALSSGHLAGAALDVMAIEPPPVDSGLFGIENLVLGSHNASNTVEASDRTHALAIDNLLQLLRLRTAR